jgi:chitosanase
MTDSDVGFHSPNPVGGRDRQTRMGSERRLYLSRRQPIRPAAAPDHASIDLTEGRGILKTFTQRYIEAGGGLAEELKPFTAGLGTKGSLAGNQRFINLLKKAGQEPCMAQVQRQEFDRMYLSRAINWGEDYGFALTLSSLVIADSYLHSGSMLGFLMNRFPERKPIDGGDEKTWIRSYLEVRHRWLRTHSNKILNGTVYRADCYMREAANGNGIFQIVRLSCMVHGSPNNMKV